MDENLSFLHFLPMLPGVIFLLAGLLLQYRPPKKINDLYGYRSALSMSSEQMWHIAQVVAAKELIRLGAVQAGIGLLVGYTIANEVFPVAYLLVSAIACGLAVMIRTESQLRSAAEKGGTRVE